MKKAIAVILIIIFLFFFMSLIFKIVQVKGSRSPSYKNDSNCLVNKLAYLFVPPQRSDLVVIKNKKVDIENIIRIIGLSNESIVFKNGHVYIDGQLLDEPYLPEVSKGQTTWYESEGKKLTVPANSYIVLSDSSRTYYFDENGFVNRNEIIGKVEFCK